MSLRRGCSSVAVRGALILTGLFYIALAAVGITWWLNS